MFGRVPEGSLVRRVRHLNAAQHQHKIKALTTRNPSKANRINT
jgi:hypothetical protein